MQKFYLRQNSDLIDRFEKAFDVLPPDIKNVSEKKKIFDISCRNKTAAIARCRKENTSSSGLEKTLAAIRFAAIKNIDGF